METTLGSRKSHTRSGCTNGAMKPSGRGVHVHRHRDPAGLFVLVEGLAQISCTGS